MNYALLTYEPIHGAYNLGDYIQSLAARQYLPRVDCLLNRERLSAYGGPEAKIILNGWFTHHPETWVPSPRLHPLFVSFHVNQSAASRILNPAGVQYLRKHAPIGCRDHDTVERLRRHGIEAYFTGCLTLTLGGFRTANPSRQKVYIVDPLFTIPTLGEMLTSPRRFLAALRSREYRCLGRRARLLRQILSPELRAEASVRRHIHSSVSVSEDEKFLLAERYLKEYADARLVITSRIHCALPCLAMGVPVVFINSSDKTDNRLGGILDLFNRVDIGSDGKVSSNFGLRGLVDSNHVPDNPSRYLALAADLQRVTAEFAAER